MIFTGCNDIWCDDTVNYVNVSGFILNLRKKHLIGKTVIYKMSCT